jgi:hypothetical protein
MPTLALPLLAGCSLYFGDHGSTSTPPAPADSGVYLHALTVDHSVSAEGTICGVDADQQGGVWLVYTTPGDVSAQVYPVVSVVHWDPTTRTRLATFTYADVYSPVSGIALVQGQLWLNYEDIQAGDQVLRVIDPGSGAIVATFATTGVDVSAMGSGQILLSTWTAVDVLDSATGGITSSFASPTTVDPSEMGGISFPMTEQGIAWRPGEIWVANWYMPSEVFDETGDVIGTVDLSSLLTEGASPTRYLKFDRGQLLVGFGGQLTWYDVQ